MTDVIYDIYEIIRESFDQKIEIQVQLHDYLPIMGDATSLSQALMNICNNARDAMPDGGRLTISASRQDQQVLVQISDTGEGMDKETVVKCFDPFFTSKPLGKGTGLGLSTTYGIVKSHEGLIIVDSKPHQGTSIKIQFTLATEEANSKPTCGIDIICGDGELVLVVDDEPEIRNALKGMLKHLGYRSDFASSGLEGVARYRSQKPDVVLMDINMPDMDGIASIEEILKYDPEASISIFSGYNQEAMDNLNPDARAAIKDFIPKPVGLETLSRLLAKMLKKK